MTRLRRDDGQGLTAWRHLAPATPRLQEIGGSHARRDLLQRTWLDVPLHSGHAGVTRTRADTLQAGLR